MAATMLSANRSTTVPDQSVTLNLIMMSFYGFVIESQVRISLTFPVGIAISSLQFRHELNVNPRKSDVRHLLHHQELASIGLKISRRAFDWRFNPLEGNQPKFPFYRIFSGRNR